MASLQLRGKVWHVRYRLAGREISESTHTQDLTIAKRVLQKRENELSEWYRTRRHAEVMGQARKSGKQPGVYFVRGDGNLIKIGFSVDMTTRARQLELQGSSDLEIIAMVPCFNFRQVEKALHYRYKDRRIKGEWFRLNGLELARAIGFALRRAADAHQKATSDVALGRDMPQIPQEATVQTAVNTAL